MDSAYPYSYQTNNACVAKNFLELITTQGKLYVNHMKEKSKMAYVYY